MDQQGWYTFKVEGPTKPYTVETTFVQVGQSVKRALELLLLADQGRRDPRALGRRQRPGRHDVQLSGDDQSIASPGAYIAPGQDIVLAGPNGLLETQPAPGDDATWFPNLYDDLTGWAPTRSTAASSRVSDALPAAEVRPALRHLGAAVGGGLQPEPGHLALARPLPGRRGGLDPAERADARARARA